jgi:hypothetical protein
MDRAEEGGSRESKIDDDSPLTPKLEEVEIEPPENARKSG